MTRTFIALDKNTDLQRHLTEVIRQVAPSFPHVRWINPANIHLTLAFIGELDTQALSFAITATRDATAQLRSFSYSLTHIGIFGTVRHPRVIWMGLSDTSNTLIRLYNTLKHNLRQYDLEIDPRPYSPHFTLAYIKSPFSLPHQQTLQNLLDNSSRFASPTPYSAKSVHVMKSDLTRYGPVYTSLHSFPLSAL